MCPVGCMTSQGQSQGQAVTLFDVVCCITGLHGEAGVRRVEVSS